MESKALKVSSDQLMHFVKKEEYMIQILNHNYLYPRICCEDAIKALFKSNVYVPMKCFCDIPLECIQNHIKTYGPYGIGFTKAWGYKAGLTPVNYYNENSPYIQSIKEIHNDYISRLNISLKDTDRSDIAEMLRILKSSFSMHKPIYGEYERSPESGGHYYFYDEREWRYQLPPISSTAYLQSHNLPQSIIDNYNGVEEDGEWKPGTLERNHQIKFTYEDIDFVLIPSFCDKKEVIDKLTITRSNIEKIKDKITTLEALIAETK